MSKKAKGCLFSQLEVLEVNIKWIDILQHAATNIATQTKEKKQKTDMLNVKIEVRVA